jgi:uncharacterized protein YcfL
VGGRRSGKITDILEISPSSRRKMRSLNYAIASSRIEEIVFSSSDLLKDTREIAKSIMLSDQFFVEVKDKYKKKKQEKDELQRDIKNDWAMYKYNNQIEVRRETDENITLSVLEALWEKIKDK